MGFRESISEYVHTPTGLVGVTPNAAGWSSGNPLVETATSAIFLKKIEGITIHDAHINATAMFSCAEMSREGFFSKLPYDKNSRISHDDVIALVAGASFMDEYLSLLLLHRYVLDYGKSHTWTLATGGRFYWDAFTKPWHYAYYNLAAGESVGYLAKISLAVFIVYDALFNKSNSSDKKLMWIMLETVQNRSKLIDMASSFWYRRLAKTWGSIQNVFIKYYGPNHVFSVYSGAFK